MTAVNEAPVTVVIPAHDEATTLGRLLDRIAEFGSLADVVVVANGCTDDTAGVASRFPWARVLEIDVASKRAALNAGDREAKHPVRIYLDADVSVSSETLLGLTRLLQTPDPVVASPAVRIDRSGASILARAYQDIWALTDYRLDDHTGSGIYGLSEAGRARFEEFPDVIADDLYVRMLFQPEERRLSPGEPFVIHAPRSLRAQARRLRRTMAGEIQLGTLFPQLERRPGARRRLVERVARRPALWPAFVVYAATYAVGRQGARSKIAAGRTAVWERDLTTR